MGSSDATSMSRASKNACNSSKEITQSIAPFVLGRRNSIFFDVQGPIKTTFAVGSVRLMMFAASTMGELEEEIYCFNSGKFFSTNMTKDGQQEVVIRPFSLNSPAS